MVSILWLCRLRICVCVKVIMWRFRVGVFMFGEFLLSLIGCLYV